MAPGDKMYHVVSYDPKKKLNKFTAYKTRALADDAFSKLNGQLAKIMISGETGDLLRGAGEQNWKDQCLGMFLTQRYSGKYYGQS
mmetsp:Transcript_5191/g.8018  ORF Transcript_5191/g.8018 Transcript_5191/m.8018 type:complete len:85 (+) Transcript_5191:679-933(+)